ncbi:MAG: transporter substrate-binding domain-containing protein [Flexilinea sp.]|nr:transporter substrate-binding domain-containing protein [Flexilinea sp.]
MKKISAILLIMVFIMSFAAVQADDLSDVLLNGVLRMGTAPEYVPFIFYDEDGNMTGIDVALVEEIGRRMGVKVQTIDIAFDGLIDSLKIGQVDIIGCGLARTENRLEQIDFTRIYYKGEAQFIALASLAKPETMDYNSFRNLKIGVQKATNFEQWIRDNLVSGGYVDVRSVYIYSNSTDLMKALNRKDVDLAILDQDIYEEVYRPTGNYQVFYDGFLEENYAFGLRKNSTLTDTVNKHLLDMLRDGTAQQIAERFFKMDYTKTDPAIMRPTQAPTAAPVIPPVAAPTQAPASSCINSMVYYSDVTIKDGQQVAPGERFRKIWRVYNNGTCSWNSGYSFVYVSGDRMEGNNISIPATVAPGQTIDLAVDLIAPKSSGTYRGNWQMRSPQGTNFGETIWVKVRVAGSQPVSPTPTPRQEDGQHYVPINVNSFYADGYEGSEGSCTNVYWSTKGASMVEITVDGTSMYRGDSVNGSKQICGPITKPGNHFVQLYAFNVTTDAYSSFTYTTREEGQHRVIPQINYFYADPSSGYLGESTTVYWSVSNAGGIDIYVDGNQIERSSNATGAASVQATIQSIGSHSIRLVAHSVTDDAESSVVYTTMEHPTGLIVPEEDQGGWAGANYYDNEDQGGWAGSNYYDEGDQGGWADSNYEEEDIGGWAGANYYDEGDQGGEN